MPHGGDIKFKIGFQTDKTGLNEIISSLQQVQTQASKMRKNNRFKEQFTEAAAAAKQLQGIISGAWNEKLGQLNLNKLNQDIKSSYGGVQQLKDKLALAGNTGRTAFNNLGMSVLNTNTQLRESNKLLDDMATSMANTIKWGITSSIFNKITGSIQSAYFYAKDLDRSLNNIRIVTGDSADQMERFARVANNTAKELGRSTLDYTKAAVSFYQQGLNDEEVAARSEISLKAQNITGAGSEILDQLTAVWNGFQIGSEQAESTVDKLAAVADNSASNMSELATAMSKVAATANVMGVNVDQLTAQLATVIATTRQAPESVGTAFKTIYTRLNDIKTGADGAEVSLGKYSGAMAELGFNVLDASGNLRDTGQVMEQIGGRWESLTKEQQVYLAQTMGGQRQITQIMALFDNWKVYVDNLNTSLASQGTLNQKNNIYLESTAAHLQRLGTESERTADLLFDQNTVNGFVDILNGALTLFNDFISGMGGGVKTFVFFGSVVAGIFNKQIAQSILKAKRNFDLFLNTRNIQQFKQSMAAALIQINKATDLPKRRGEKPQAQDIALKKRAQVQAQLYADSLKARQGLNQQQIKELDNTQKQIGLLTEQKELITNIDRLKEQYGYSDYQTIKEFELQEQTLNRSNTQLGKALNLIRERAFLEAEGVTAGSEQEARLENIGTLLNRNSEYLKIQAKLRKDGVQEADLEKRTIEETVQKYNRQQEDIKKIIYLKDVQRQAETGQVKVLDQQIQRLKKIQQGTRNIGNEQIKMQNIIKGISAAGQGLTALGGAWSSFVAEGATAADKLNATFTGIQGTVGAVLSTIPGIGFALNGLWYGVSSVGKAFLQWIGAWDAIEDHFKSAAEKMDQINEKSKQALKVSETYSQQKAQVKGLAEEFEKLAKKRDSGISLTEEEESRYHTLVDTITQYNDKAILAYDNKGEKIVNNNKLLSDTLDLLDQQYEKQMRNAYGNAAAAEAQKVYGERYVAAKNRNDEVNSQEWQNSQTAQAKDTTRFAVGQLVDSQQANAVRQQLMAGGAENEEALSLFDLAQSRFVNIFESDQEKYLQAIENGEATEEDLALAMSKNIDHYLNMIGKIRDKATLAEGSFDPLIDFLSAQKSNFQQLLDISESVREQQMIAADSLETSEEIPIDQFIGWLEYDNRKGHNQAFTKIKNSWGDLFEDYGRDLVTTAATGLLQGYEGQFGSNEDNFYDPVFEATNEYLMTFASVDANSVKRTQDEIEKLNEDIGKKTAQDYKEKQLKIVQRLVNANKQILDSPETRELGQSILEDILGFSFEIDEKNIVTKVQTSVDKIKDAISNNITTSQEAHFVSNLINQKDLDEFIENSGKTEQQLLSLSNAIALSGKTFTNLEDFKKYFEDFFKQENNENVLKDVDKVVSAINKLQNGDNLKYKEKQDLMGQLGLKPQDLKDTETALKTLETALMDISDPEQRHQALSQIYQDLDSLNEARERLQEKNPGDYEALWDRVFQNELKTLGLTSDKLQEYGNQKKKAFKTNEDKQIVLNLYKQEQGLKNLGSSLKNITEDVKSGTWTTEISTFIELLNQLTGQNVDFTWLQANIETVTALLEDSNLSAEQLLENLVTLSGGAGSRHASDVEDKYKLQRQQSRYDNAQSAYDKITSGETSSLTEDEIAVLAYMEQQNQALKEKQRFSKEYTEQLKKQIQAQKQLVKQAREEAVEEHKKEIRKLNNRKGLAQQSIDALNDRIDSGKYSEDQETKYLQLIEYYKGQIADYDADILEQQQAIIGLEIQQKEEIQNQVDSLNQKLQSFNSYREKLAEGGTLNGDELKEFSDILDQLVSEKYPELTASAELLKQTSLSWTNEYKDALREVGQAYEQYIYGELIDQLDSALSQVKEVNLDFKVNPEQFETWVDRVNDFIDIDRTITINVLTNAESEFNQMSSELDRIYDAAGKIGENFIVAADDIRELNTVFPGIVQGMTQVDQSSYQLNSNVVQRAIGTAKTQAQADTQQVQTRLRNHATILRDKASTYTAMAKLAGQLASGELKTEDEKNAAILALNGELTNLEGQNNKLLKLQTENNNIAMADSAEGNAKSVASNWIEAAKTSAGAFYDFAVSVIDNARSVASAMAQAAEGGAVNASAIIPTINANFSGTGSFSGTHTDESAIHDTHHAIEGGLNTSAEEWEQLQHLYQQLAAVNSAAADEIDNMIIGLDAQVGQVGAGLDNVAAGYGIGGPSTDSDNSSNGSSKPDGSGSSKPSSSGNSSEKPDKEEDTTLESGPQPDQMELLEEEADRYHDIDIQLKKIQTDLKRIQELEDKYTGQKLIKNLNQQLKILKDQVDAYKEKLSIARVEAQEIRKTLQRQGVNFDSQGQIANYEFILQRKLDNLNSTINHYNLLSKEQQQGYKTVVQAAKKEYEEFKEKIERYDQLTTNLIPGLQDSITDAIDKQFEIQIKKFKINVELMLDTSQAERDFNKFRKKVIDKLRKDNILGNTRALFNDYGSYYKDGFDVIESLTDQVNNTLYEIDQIKKRGKSDVYGDNQAAAEQDLKKYTKELMSSLEDVEDIVQDIKDSIFDAIDAAQDAFDLQTDRLEYIDDLIGHGQKLTELLYGDDAYEQMNHFFELQDQNNKKELDFARRQRDMWERRVQSQRQRMLNLDPKSNAFKQAEDRLKEYQKHLKDASKNFNSYLQDTIENIIDKYKNSIDTIFDKLQKKVSNGKGFDYISEEWELMNKQADMYLDTVNSAFEINKIEQAFKDAIADNEGNLKAQQSLNNLMKEQLDYLKGKDKLTQYEVDRANALLQIEIQRLALENTRANKSKLRLRRDSQGNYTYQYVEDEEETKEAQNKLQQAQNNLYNMSKDAYLKNQEQFLKLFQEWEDKVRAIYQDTTLTVEEQKEKQALLNRYYGQMINDRMNDDAMFRGFLAEDTFSNLANMYGTDVDNFKEMSDEEQDILMQELIPQWDSGIGQMIDTFTGAGGFIPVVEESFGDLGQAVQTLEEELDEVESIARVDFDNINIYIEDAMQLTEELIADNGYLVDSYEENINAVQSLIDEIERLTDTYREAESAAIAAVSAANGFLQVTPTSNYSSSGAVDLDELVPTYEGVSSSSSSSSGYTPPSTPAPAPASTPAVDLDSMASASNTGHSGSSSRPLDSSTIEGIAAAIWLDDGGWGVDPGRRAKLTEKFGADGAAKVQSYINQQAANGFSYLTNKYWNEQGEYGGGLRNYYYSAFKTGGYTGSWGNTGKLAVLHEKELVLNKEDTRNILSAVNIVKTMDDLLSSIGTNLNNSNNILSNLSSFSNNNHSVLDQNVHITATFPAVNSRAEIENALSGLVNRASQYAYSNKK